MPGHDIPQNLFVGESVAKRRHYVCVECALILRDAVQTACGHWLCQSCIDEVFYSACVSQSIPKCPNCKDELRTSDGEMKYNIDQCARKEVLNLMMICPNREKGCMFWGRMPDYECHSCTFEYKTADYDNAELVVQNKHRLEILMDTQKHLGDLVQEVGQLVEVASSKVKQMQHNSMILSSFAQASKETVEPVNRVIPTTSKRSTCEVAESSSSLGRASDSLVASIGRSSDSDGEKATQLAVHSDMTLQGAVGGQRRSRRNSPHDHPPYLNLQFQPELPPKPPCMLPDVQRRPTVPPKQRKLASQNSHSLDGELPAIPPRPPPILASTLQPPPPLPPRPSRPPQSAPPARPPKPVTGRPTNLPRLRPNSGSLQTVCSPQVLSSAGTVVCKMCNAIIHISGLTGNLNVGDVHSQSDGHSLCHCYSTVELLKILKYLLENGKYMHTYPPRHGKHPFSRPRVHST